MVSAPAAAVAYPWSDNSEKVIRTIARRRGSLGGQALYPPLIDA